jgi:hypothetical protein
MLYFIINNFIKNCLLFCLFLKLNLFIKNTIIFCVLGVGWTVGENTNLVWISIDKKSEKILLSQYVTVKDTNGESV